jgi:hypothetical protein
MAVQIEPREDQRAKQILENPERYFDNERERVRAEVEREIAWEPAEG